MNYYKGFQVVIGFGLRVRQLAHTDLPAVFNSSLLAN